MYHSTLGVRVIKKKERSLVPVVQVFRVWGAVCRCTRVRDPGVQGAGFSATRATSQCRDAIRVKASSCLVLERISLKARGTHARECTF